jgi:hypothetical protein
MKQNAAAGVTLGLHSQQEVDLLLDRADAAFRLEANRLLAADLAAPGMDEVLRQITALRLPSRPAPPVVSSFRSCRSGDPEPCETGFSELDTPDLGKAVVATVIPGHHLKPLISDDDRKRIEESDRLRKAGVRLRWPDKPGAAVDDKSVEALRLLSPRERSFRLASRSSGGNDPVRLGGGILWFTTAAEIKRFRRLAMAPDQEADRVRDGLGLVHRTMETWLVLITFPGHVVQARGHYRPVFCDSRGSERFMAGSSHPSPRKRDAWGQTADLKPIQKAGKDELTDEPPSTGFDGALERVVPELHHDHFPTGTRARFELLGKLCNTRSNNDVSNNKFAKWLEDRNALA